MVSRKITKIVSPYYKKPVRPAVLPRIQNAPTLGGPVSELVKLVGQLTILKTDLEKSLSGSQVQTQGIEERITKVDLVLDHILGIKKGDQGRPGRDAEELDVPFIIQEVFKLIPTPKDGKDVDEEKIFTRLASKLPKEINKGDLVKEILSMIPVPKPGAPGDKGDSATPEEVLSLIMNLPKGKGLKAQHIEGLEEWYNAIKEQVGRTGAYLHGGGDTLKAGAGQTLVRNSDGTTTLVTAGGSGGAIITATNSGDNKTYTLSQALTTSSYFVSMNGGSYPTDDPQFPFSIAATTLTFTTALPSDLANTNIKVICV